MIIKVISHLVRIIIITYLTWVCSGTDIQAHYDSVNPRLVISGEQISSDLSPAIGIKLLSQGFNQDTSTFRDHSGSDDQEVEINGVGHSYDHINIFEPDGAFDGSVGETLGNVVEARITLDNDRQLESSNVRITEATGLKLVRRQENTTSDSWVKWHNFYRKKFAAPDLSWDEELATRAQRFTNRCNFEHSKPERHGPQYGENLFAGASDIRGIVNAWVNGPNEAGSYNPGAPSYSHFTQVVWRGTTRVGCAASACDDVGHFSGSEAYQEMGEKVSIVACVYFPAGNVMGQFRENVIFPFWSYPYNGGHKAFFGSIFAYFLVALVALYLAL